MAPTTRTRDRARTAGITVLLVASLVLMGILSVQTYEAVTSHERLAADVLRDYTTLAADEFDRRTSLVAFRGFYPVMARLAQIPLDDPLPTPDALLEVSDTDDPERLRRASELAQSFFRYDPTAARLTQTGQSIPHDALEALERDLETYELPSPEESIVRTFHVVVDGNEHNFVYAPVQDRFFVGIWVDDAIVLRWIEYIASTSPLLPEALTHGELAVDDIYLSLSHGRGDVIYQHGEVGDKPLFANRPLRSEIAGLHGGLRVSAGIEPAVANELVIGGLPQSRLPFLGGLWALTAMTILVAMVLLRRERALIRLRSDFISRVSHELRTPLTQILMFAQTLLLDRVRTDEDRKRSLSVIDKEARRLSLLVENILQFSRGERGAMEVALAPQPLVPIVREITDQFRPLLKDARQLRVSSAIDDDLEVPLDIPAFQQMVVNLLDNAVKYSPDGEGIDVTLSANDDAVSVSVEDHGPGIPESERARIWEPYYRASDDTNAAIGGNGIGLAVVKELARLHHARVEVTDREGGGSRFTIDFERETAAA